MSWIELLLCAWIGWERRPAWWPALVGLAGAALNIALAWQWWAEAGLAVGHRTPSLIVIHLVASFAGYGAGRLAARFRRRGPAPG